MCSLRTLDQLPVASIPYIFLCVIAPTDGCLFWSSHFYIVFSTFLLDFLLHTSRITVANQLSKIKMISYTRGMLLGALRKCWKSVISSSYGSTVKPLSSEVWSTLRSYGILAQFRGQRGGNHLRKIYSKKIITIESSAERKIYTGCKQRKANLCNLLNIQFPLLQSTRLEQHQWHHYFLLELFPRLKLMMKTMLFRIAILLC